MVTIKSDSKILIIKCDHLTIKARITTPTDAPIVNRAHFGNVDIQTGSISFSGVASLTIRVQIFLAKPYVRTYSPRTSFKTMALFSVQGGLLDDMKNSKVFSR